MQNNPDKDLAIVMGPLCPGWDRAFYRLSRRLEAESIAKGENPLPGNQGFDASATTRVARKDAA